MCEGLGCHVTPSWASVSFLGIDWRFRTPWGQEDLGGSNPGLTRAPTPKPWAQAPCAEQPGDTMLTYRLPVTLKANTGHMTMTVTGSRASLRLPAPTPMLSCAPQAPILHSSGWALVLTPSAESLRAAPPSAASRRALRQATLYTCSSFRASVQPQGSGILPEPPNWVPASEVGRPFPLATGRGNICKEKKR